MSQENPTTKQPLIRHVNRQQLSWRAVDVDHLISEDHPARAVWTLVGRLNLSALGLKRGMLLAGLQNEVLREEVIDYVMDQFEAEMKKALQLKADRMDATRR